jgi:hypothetical protein
VVEGLWLAIACCLVHVGVRQASGRISPALA